MVWSMLCGFFVAPRGLVTPVCTESRLGSLSFYKLSFESGDTGGVSHYVYRFV